MTGGLTASYKKGGTIMVNISTLGSCVTRDILRIANDEGLFNMKGNVGHISPMTMFSAPVEDCDEIIEKIQEYETGFNKRNAIMDLNSNALDFILADKSEWLLVDLMDLRFDYYQKDDKLVSYFPNHDQITEGLLMLKEKGFMLHRAKYIPPERIFKAIDVLAAKILEHWDRNKIIVINDLPQDLLLYEDRGKDNGFLKWAKNDMGPNMQHLDIFNKYFRRKLRFCHMIEMPPMQITPCSLTHTFGIYPCHYTDDVYRYLFHQICKIVFPDQKDFYEKRRLHTLDKIRKTYYRSLRRDVKTILTDDIIKLHTTDKFFDYFRHIRNLENCVVCVAVRGTVGKHFDFFMQKLFRTIGFSEKIYKKYWSGYVGVVKSGTTICDKISRMNHSAEFIDDIDFTKFNICSRPNKAGNSASIVIDGVDYAMNTRGINVVVYDMSTQRVVDSVAFDTAKKALPMLRKPELLTENELLRVSLAKLQDK